MMTENTVKCPNCGTDINVNDMIYHQVEDSLKKEFETESAKKEKEFQGKMQQLKAERDKIKLEQEKLNEVVEQKVLDQLRAEKEKLEKSIKARLNSENDELIKSLKEQLDEKSDKVKELNRTQAEVEKLRREKDELGEKVALEKEKEFSEKLNNEKNRIREQVENESSLRVREKEKIISDLNKQLEEAQRKAQQGSAQLKGEVQELELENILRDVHRYDQIDEVRKGQRGADVVQIVKNQFGTECGKIYYESKRTKKFDNNWLQKLRDDNLEIKADVLVLVAEVMPEGQDKFFFKDGIWICSLWEVKGLSMVLRHGIIQLHALAITNQGKDTKMEIIYKYLTSQEFSGQLRAIFEGFRDLQISNNDEKLRMQKVWKEREKQMEKILSNAVSFYGSIKGLAGAEIPDIKMLEGGE